MKTYKVTVNGQVFEVSVEASEDAGEHTAASRQEISSQKAEQQRSENTASNSNEGLKVVSPMPGVILEVKAQVGEQLKEGQSIAVLEAMKMENDIVAPKAGKVVSIAVNKGDTVETNQLIAIIKEN